MLTLNSLTNNRPPPKVFTNFLGLGKHLLSFGSPLPSFLKLEDEDTIRMRESCQYETEHVRSC